MTVYTVIQELKATRSRNEKESILKREIDNEELKDFFRLALNPFINFFQKKKFIFENSQVSTVTLKDGMAVLETQISKRVVTGGAAISVINEILRGSTTEDAIVLQHILQKESGCDLGGATINKIWSKLIPTFPTLLATAYDEKLAAKLNWERGVYSQLKSDGLRVNLVIDEEGIVKAYSRAGNELNFFGMFDFLGDHVQGVVIDGELLTVKPDGKFNNRQTSNGICSKAIKNTMSLSEAETLHMTSWDMIPLADFRAEKSAIEYSERFENLDIFVHTIPKNIRISLIESKIVHSIDEAQEHYVEAIGRGEEGTMNKDMDMLWEDARSKKQLKLKSEHTGDFVIKGYKDGVGKFTGLMGSLIIATSDDKLEANMSGYSIKLRCEITANLQNREVSYTMVEDNKEVVYVAKPGDCDIDIGTIIECMYNQKIKARNTEIWSVFLPRFKQTRNDKTVANTLEEIK